VRVCWDVFPLVGIPAFAAEETMTGRPRIYECVMERKTVRLPTELIEELEREAAEKAQTFSQYVRGLLEGEE